ncbi:MAG: DUF6580 family putative transport protein [Verrucomicrobiota bacterium]
MIPAALILIITVVAFRLIPGIPAEWQNFSPMAAIFLCSATYLPKRLALTVPLITFLITDAILNSRNGLPPITPFTAVLALAFGLTFALGWSLRTNPKALRVFSATIAASLAFYLITNTAAWLGSPAYTKNVAGWWQALTTGTPGFPPTLLFLRNTLLGDLTFTALFVACTAWLPRPSLKTQNRLTTHDPDPTTAPSSHS